MGIVEDDRPKEKTSLGIKTYKKTEQTLVHAYDKGEGSDKRRLGHTQMPFNHSTLDYLVPTGV
jgi:phosphoribosylaminoimidazole carboxylase (NCAIR synthetase)